MSLSLSSLSVNISIGVSGISAGLAGLITAQKIINFSLNLREERNLLTISDGKKLSIENIVVKSNHNIYFLAFY